MHVYLWLQTSACVLRSMHVQVNDHVIENVRHEEAVSALKFGGDEVTLVVKYYRPASFLLSKS